MATVIDLNVNYRLHAEDLPYGRFMAPEARKAASAPVDVGELLSRMDAAGIAMAGVVANVSAAGVRRYGGRVLDDNTADIVKQAISGHEDRLFGWVGVNPLGGMKTVRYIDRSVRELGFKGVHIFPHWFVLPVNDKIYYPIYSKCAELGVPIAMQCGIGGSPSGGKVVAAPMQVREILYDFPELVLIALRVGQPWERDFVTLGRKYPNLVLGADNPPSHWAPEFIDALNGRVLGMDKDITQNIVWGTNGRRSAQEELDQIRALGLSPAVRDKVLGGNASRILGLAPN
jgi:predicted TIM-barrel fold metal-dependent hydrolase